MTPISVYVHFPWCLQKCPYCDFASKSIDRASVPHAQYADAVIAELEHRVGTMDTSHHKLVSVFFGGGTPSLWQSSELGRVLDRILQLFPHHAENIEISAECNPSSLDRVQAAALRDAGVNRLSIGVQSLNETELRFLGRLHDAELALKSIADAMLEHNRVSADLMFGLPSQSPAEFDLHLRRILDLGLTHLSMYALTIEPATQFGALHRKGKLPIAKEENVADTFVQNQQNVREYGLVPYEVSNFARPGEEARHNLHYWHAGQYLGIGAGAVGCISTGATARRRWRNRPEPGEYMQNARSLAREDSSEDLNATDVANEAIMLGLRTREGLDLSWLERETGIALASQRAEQIEKRIAAGDLVRTDRGLAVPTDRWVRLDPIVLDLFL